MLLHSTRFQLNISFSYSLTQYQSLLKTMLARWIHYLNFPASTWGLSTPHPSRFLHVTTPLLLWLHQSWFGGSTLFPLSFNYSNSFLSNSENWLQASTLHLE